MENREGVVLRWRKYENYLPRRIQVILNGDMFYIGSGGEENEDSRYESYLKEEINDRIKRHEPVLALFDISEKPNPNDPMDVDYFSGDNYLCTCTTGWDKSRYGLMDDNNPFSRVVLLSDKETLKIRDKAWNDAGRSEDDEENVFETIFTLYRVKEKVESDSLELISMEKEKSREPELEQEMNIEYKVNAYNKPISIVLNYNGSILHISKNYYMFQYASDSRQRRIEYGKGYDLGATTYKGEYEEGTWSYDPLRGKVSVSSSFCESTLRTYYEFSAGFGSGCPTKKITEEQAENYAHAIASHERSKETMRAVIRFISKRITKIEEFISENFASFIEFLDNDEYHIPEIDYFFEKITNHYLAFGEDGFAHKETPELNEAIMEDESIKRMSKRKREKLRRQKLIVEYLKKHREEPSNK